MSPRFSTGSISIPRAYQFAYKPCLLLQGREANFPDFESQKPCIGISIANTSLDGRMRPLGLRYLIGRTLQVDHRPPSAVRVFTRRHDFTTPPTPSLEFQYPHRVLTRLVFTAQLTITVPHLPVQPALRLISGHLLKAGHTSLQESSPIAPRCQLVTVRFNRAVHL